MPWSNFSFAFCPRGIRVSCTSPSTRLRREPMSPGNFNGRLAKLEKAVRALEREVGEPRQHDEGPKIVKTRPRRNKQKCPLVPRLSHKRIRPKHMHKTLKQSGVPPLITGEENHSVGGKIRSSLPLYFPPQATAPEIFTGLTCATSLANSLARTAGRMDSRLHRAPAITRSIRVKTSTTTASPLIFSKDNFRRLVRHVYIDAPAIPYHP